MSRGVSSAIREVAYDKLVDSLTSAGQSAIGADPDSLLTYRTAKVQAVSTAARAAFPELNRVEQTLTLSLEAIKAAAFHEDGTELGDIGAILRKNIMVREEITAALGKLATLASEAVAAKADAESRRPEVLADIERFNNQLSSLQSQLEALRIEWSAEQAAERAAANAAAVIPPPNIPVPEVNLPRDPEENDDSYSARVRAAIIAAAQERWNLESPGIIADIEGPKAYIEAREATLLEAEYDTFGNARLESFITTHRGSDKVDVNITSSYSSTLGNYDALQRWIETVTAAAPSLSNLIQQAETIADRYAELETDRNKLSGLVSMLADSGVWPLPDNYDPAFDGFGQQSVEAHAVDYAQTLSELSVAVENAQKKLEQLGRAADAWSSGIHAVRADLDAQLAAAESALAVLIARGEAWDAALAAATGLTVERVDLESRVGYYDADTFIPVITHAFSLATYRQALLAALSQPGPDGLAAAKNLKQKYNTLVALSASLKDSYDSAVLRYYTAYAHLNGYAGSSGFPVLDDLRGAASVNLGAYPVDDSGITDQAERFRSLSYTTHNMHATNQDGGPPNPGEFAMLWIGLPKLRQLPDPELENSDDYLAHRLLALKEAVVQDGPGWINLTPAQFEANCDDTTVELFALLDDANADGEIDLRTPISDVLYEIDSLYYTYAAAHPSPVITVQPESSDNDIPAGTTFSTTLSVAATGDFLTYEWYTTPWPGYEWAWEKIEGASASTYTTPPLTSTAFYRVHISNPGGTVISHIATVGVYEIYPPPEFTSPDHATAQVGVPFSWTFTTEPAGWVSPHDDDLPPGLNFNYATGQLEGTPLVAGSYELNIMALNNDASGFQTFTLTVEPGTLTGYDNWLVQWTTPEGQLNRYYIEPLSTPADDGVPNLLKYAFNLLGTGPGQTDSILTPNSRVLAAAGAAGLPAIGVSGDGRVTLLYVRRKASSQPDIIYVVEFSNPLEPDSWAANASATETVTSLDDTWERVLVTDSLAATPRRFVRVRVERP